MLFAAPIGPVLSGVVPGTGIVIVGESPNPGALAYTVCALVALGSVTFLLTDLEALGIMIVRGLVTPWSVTINPPLGIVPPEAVTVIDCCVPDRAPAVLIARVPGADTVIFIVAESNVPFGSVAISVYVSGVLGSVIVSAVPVRTVRDGVRAVPLSRTDKPGTDTSAAVSAFTVTDRVRPSPVVEIVSLFVVCGGGGGGGLPPLMSKITSSIILSPIAGPVAGSVAGSVSKRCAVTLSEPEVSPGSKKTKAMPCVSVWTGRRPPAVGSAAVDGSSNVPSLVLNST